MRISNFAGLLDSTAEEFQVVNGETFYKTHITIKEQRTPVVVSEYILKDMLGKHVNVQGYIRTDSVDEKLFTFIFASNMAEQEGEPVNLCDIKFTGRIRSVKEMSVAPNCRETLPLVVHYTAPDRHFCVVHVNLVGATARKYASVGLKKGDDVYVEGYLNPRGPLVTVIATNFELKGGASDAQSVG